MNLIEQLGGYERAKYEFEMIKEMKPIYPDEIETNDRLLLEYRRKHNIFEVGDKVVFEDNEIYMDESKIYEIVEFLDGGEVVLSNDDCLDPVIIRHATDAEIAAGKRL